MLHFSVSVLDIGGRNESVYKNEHHVKSCGGMYYRDEQ
jgi:hypothetical protein